jgi:hypothetical protein
MEVVALPSAAKDWNGAIKPVAKISVKRVKILPQYFAFLIFFVAPYALSQQRE